MSTIVSTLPQTLRNIERFGEELALSEELQGRLAFARSWYAHQGANDEWHFAPSKFCGYKDMTAKEYVNDDPRDGRRTEKQLQSWFTTLSALDPLFEELSERLTGFLAQYGKPPSSAMRINVSNDFYAAYRDRGSDTSSDRTIADLLIAVAARLPNAERSRVRDAL